MSKKAFTAAHRLTQLHNFTTDKGKQEMENLFAEEDRQAEIIDRRIADGTLASPFKKIRDLPYGFEYIGTQSVYANAHLAMKGKYVGLQVLSSVAIADDLAWYHVSFSRKDRLPNYEETKAVKKYWFGDDKWAIQIFPPKSDHVNIHVHCLHLWTCLDPFPMPSFVYEGHI